MVSHGQSWSTTVPLVSFACCYRVLLSSGGAIIHVAQCTSTLPDTAVLLVCVIVRHTKLQRPVSPRVSHEPPLQQYSTYASADRARKNVRKPTAYRVVREVEAVTGHHAESRHQRGRPPAQQQQHGRARPAQGPEPYVVQEHRRRPCSESRRRRRRRRRLRCCRDLGAGAALERRGCVGPPAQLGGRQRNTWIDQFNMYAS